MRLSNIKHLLAFFVKLEFEIMNKFDTMANSRISQYRLLSGAFGFTPANRSNVDTGKRPDAGEFNEF